MTVKKKILINTFCMFWGLLLFGNCSFLFPPGDTSTLSFAPLSQPTPQPTVFIEPDTILAVTINVDTPGAIVDEITPIWLSLIDETEKFYLNASLAVNGGTVQVKQAPPIFYIMIVYDPTGDWDPNAEDTFAGQGTLVQYYEDASYIQVLYGEAVATSLEILPGEIQLITIHLDEEDDISALLEPPQLQTTEPLPTDQFTPPPSYVPSPTPKVTPAWSGWEVITDS